ncbi:MAG: PAS domain S-box protein [bacterium]|nr:PAS domain S-box protein [bacterium]
MPDLHESDGTQYVSRRTFTILLPPFLAMGLLLAAVFFAILPRFEESYVAHRKRMLRELTTTASRAVGVFEAAERRGELSRDKAQRAAFSQLRVMRYGENDTGYFWVNDLDGRMLMHPQRPSLEGLDMIDYTDAFGNRPIAAVTRFARDHGEGLVEYKWLRTDDAEGAAPKVSYVKVFEPWGWVLGTGAYLDTMDQEIRSIRLGMEVASIGAIVIVGMVCAYLVHHGARADAKREALEQDLRISEQRHRALYEAAKDAIIVLRGECIADCNPAAESLWRASRNEIVGRPLTEYVSAATVCDPALDDDLGELIGTALDGQAQHFELKYALQDLSTVFADVNLARLEWDSKPAVLAVMRNTTQRHRAEELVREGEERYRLLFSSMTNGFALHEIILSGEGAPVDYRFLEANPAFERMTGVASGELEGKTVLEVLPSTERWWIETYGNVAVTGVPTRFVNYSQELRRYYEVVAYSPRQGQFAVVFDDVTERKETELALRESQERLKTIFDAVQTGILIVDVETRRIVDVNPAAAALIGADRGAIVGRECHRFVCPDRAGQCPVCDLGDSVDNSERELLDVDGVRIPILKTAVPVILKGRAHLVESFLDLRERKRAEREAKLARDQLIKADKMVSLGILVSGVAHEINNPNHIILSHISLLAKIWRDIAPIANRYHEANGDFDAGGLDYSEIRGDIPALFETVENASNRIKSIVEELREFAHDKPRRLDEPVRINSVLQSALVLLTNFLKKSTHHFHVEYGEGVPTFPGNCQRLEQVIINLIQNACQALEDPGKAIRVRTFHDPATNHVVLEVSDEGAGIARGDMPHITDPFFTTRREAGGTGLGLSISTQMIKEHGGHLAISSTPGQGTIASVRIPAGEGQEGQQT